MTTRPIEKVIEERDPVGVRIRRLRTARGLTQRELAEPSYSRAFLAAVEAGVRKPSERMVVHVAHRLGVDPEDLRAGRPPGAAADLADALHQARRALSQGRIAYAAGVFDEIHTDATRYALTELAYWAAYWLGEARLQGGDLHAAEAQFERVLALPQPASPAPRAAVLARWAYCRFAGGDSSAAVAALEAELRTQRESTTVCPDAQVRLSSGLIYAFVNLDWLARARRLEAETLPMLPQVTRPEWRAQFYTTVGQSRRSAADLPEAERMFVDAARTYRELGLTREVGLCHWAHGYVLRRVGRLDQAAVEFTAACEVLLGVGAMQDHAGATLELAEVRRRQGELGEAARLTNSVVPVCSQFGHVECMAEADRLLGMIAVAREDPTTAERLLVQAAARYEEIGVLAEVVTTCRILGDVLLGAHRGTEAAAAFRRGLGAAEKMRQRSGEATAGTTTADGPRTPEQPVPSRAVTAPTADEHRTAEQNLTGEPAAEPPPGAGEGRSEEVGRRIHRLRVARGLTQRELAAPRYTAAYVSSVESGRRTPSTDAVAHFAERLGTSRQELATGRAPGHGVRTGLDLAMADALAGNDPPAAEAAYLRLSARSAAAGDAIRQAHCHLGLGRLALDRGDTARAGQEFDEAERLSAGAPVHLRVRPVIEHAECVRRQGDARYAAYLLTRTLDELVGAGLPDPGALLGLHAYLALCHSDLGDEAEAASAAAAALALAGPRDARTVADLHVEVARTLMAGGDAHGAEVALIQAGQARRQAALTVELARCRLIRGRMRRSVGDLTGALRDLTVAHRSFTTAARADLITDSAVDLAAVYQVLGRGPEARDLLAGLPTGEPDDPRPPAGDRVLALLAVDDGDLRSAERHLRSAVDGYRRHGPRRELAAVVLVLADVLQAQDRTDEALRVLQDGLVEVERRADDVQRPPTGPVAAAQN